MEIRVEVETEDRFTKARQKALIAPFIFVALDPKGKPAEVPPLLITAEEGEEYFQEGRKRHQGRKKLRYRRQSVFGKGGAVRKPPRP